jgi:aldose 1-epimerase
MFYELVTHQMADIQDHKETHSPRATFGISIYPRKKLLIAVFVLLFTMMILYLLNLLVASSSVIRPLIVQASSDSISSEIATATASSPFTLYTLTSENISATFIPYGARLTSLLVPDRSGTDQDIVVGYDDPVQYAVDSATNHTYFGTLVGRYGNRIKNGTFTLDGKTFAIPTNENNGANTLHGGLIGYDQRNWTVTSLSDTSITFTLFDDAFEGFPGSVITHATYALSSAISGSRGERNPRLTVRTVSIALDQATPIMLVPHFYWNLGAFTTPTVLDDQILWMPYSKRYVEVDDILVPTGAIGTVASRRVLDFTLPKTIGRDLQGTTDLCGHGCTGYDTSFILDRPHSTGAEAMNFPVLSLWSITTGIRMDVSTNQQGLQIYSCNGQNGTIPVKPSQIQRNSQGSGGGGKFIEQYGCVVVETQGWIDGVNHPEWGNSQYWIYSPKTGPAVNHATYDFSVI